MGLCPKPRRMQRHAGLRRGAGEGLSGKRRLWPLRHLAELPAWRPAGDAVLNSPYGFAAWAHNGTAMPGGDALTNDGYTLTDYGKRVAARLAKP